MWQFAIVAESKMVCTGSDNGVSPLPTQYGQVIDWQEMHSTSRGGSQLQLVPTYRPQPQQASLPDEQAPSPQQGQFGSQSLAGQLDQQSGQQLPTAESRATQLVGPPPPAELPVVVVTTPLIRELQDRDYAEKPPVQKQQSEQASENKPEARTGDVEEKRPKDADVEKQQTGLQSPQEPSQQAEGSVPAERRDKEATAAGAVAARTEDKPAEQNTRSEKPASERGEQPAGETKAADGAAQAENKGHKPEVFIYTLTHKNVSLL